jgi:hypothetical protein
MGGGSVGGMSEHFNECDIFPYLHMYVVDIFWITSFDFFERKLAEMPGKPQSVFFEGFYISQIQACILYTVYYISAARTNSIGRGNAQHCPNFLFLSTNWVNPPSPSLSFLCVEDIFLGAPAEDIRRRFLTQSKTVSVDD